MAPPSTPAGKGKNGGAQIIEFRGKRPGEPPSPATEASEKPDSGPRSSPPPPARPSLYQFDDFSDLQTIMSGRSPRQSVGAYGKIQLYLDLLANPKANGGFQATLVRDNQAFEFTQEKPGDPVQVKFYQENAGRSKTAPPERTPRFQLTYFPDGQLRHTSFFDAEGQAVNEKWIPEENLRGAALGDHEAILDFIRKRQVQLGKGRYAFDRMEAPLQQLRPSSRDLAQRAAWYQNFVVVDKKVYSIRVQNPGFGQLEQKPTSQNSIAVFEDQGSQSIELFRFSKTGEFNFSGEGTQRQLPTPKQLVLLDKICHQLEKAAEDPQAYQEGLHRQLQGLEKRFKLSTQWKRPQIRPTPFHAHPTWKNLGPFGEPIETITTYQDLRRILDIIKPHTWRWENPENPSEVRYLRPKGKIYRAMLWESARWIGNEIWNKSVNPSTNLPFQPGKMKLHLLPDEESADLETYRNYTRQYPDGTLREERGIHNIIRRNADGSSIDLGSIVKQIAKTQPDILELPRAEQLKLAFQTLNINSNVPRSLEVQIIPEIPIHQLQIKGHGPSSAAEAWNALLELPQFHGLKAQAQGEFGEGLLEGALKMIQGQATELGRESKYQLTFPGGHPSTHLEISETNHTTGTRVVVFLWQGDNVSTAVYDEGSLNEHESVRLNLAQVNRAREGTVRPSWKTVIGKSWIAQPRTYLELHGAAYVLGYLSSLPVTWAYERAFWTPEQRNLIGMKAPELTINNLAYEGLGMLIMMGFAGGMATTVDGIFNYGGGLLNTLGDKFKRGLTWRESYRTHSPRILNPPPALLRPLPRPTLSLSEVYHHPPRWALPFRTLRWASPHLRALLQRGVPLFSALLAVSAYHEIGKDWKLSDVKNMDREKLMHTFYHVGTVSLMSSAAWGLIGRRTELALARQAAGQPIRGLGGFLLRRKFLARVPEKIAGQMAGARFALNYRATLFTVALEMAALGIWDAVDRKNDLISREKNYRSDLSRNMDRYNRILSRLENGEAISPQKIQEAEAGVQEAYQNYQGYLKLMEKSEGPEGFTPVKLKNDFGEIYRAMNQDHWLARGGLMPTSLEPPAIARWEYENRLQHLKDGELKLERQLRDLYRSHGLPFTDPRPEEDLRVFLARTMKILNKNPQSLDEALQPSPSQKSPLALEDPQARALIDHLNWKIKQEPGFLKQPPAIQARYILKTFRGYRVKAADGTDRPWNENEAMAFLNAVATENQRRLAHGEEPLLKSSKGPAPSPEKLEKLYQEEAKIIAETTQGNRYIGEISTTLADNGRALEKQMEDYLTRANRKRDEALVRFLPPELLARQETSAHAEVL